MAWLISVPHVPQYQPQFEFLDKPPGYNHWAPTDVKTIPAEHMPDSARIFTGHKALHDVFHVETELAVSRRFMEIIEAFEPGVHQFFPVRLLRKNGEPFEGEYFLLNIRVAFNALNTDQSDLHWTEVEREGLTVRLPHITFGRIVLQKGAVEGHHLWRHKVTWQEEGAELGFGTARVFCSDALYQEILRKKIKKFNARKAEELADEGGVQH